MTDAAPTHVEDDHEVGDIPNPDALGLIPYFEPPAGEDHPEAVNR